MLFEQAKWLVQVVGILTYLDREAVLANTSSGLNTVRRAQKGEHLEIKSGRRKQKRSGVFFKVSPAFHIPAESFLI